MAGIKGGIVSMEKNKMTADRIYYEFQKTFKGVKNPPRFSFLMKLVKLIGEEEVVKRLGHLREYKDIDKIKDFNPYLMSVCRKSIINNQIIK